MSTHEHQNTTPRLLLNRSFNDMGQLGRTTLFDLDFRQIEAGKLLARAALLAGPGNMVMRVEFDRKFHQRGHPPRGVLTFGFPDSRSGQMRWNRQSAPAGALLNFNNGRFDGVNPGKFGGFTLSFTADLLDETAGILGIDFDHASHIRDHAFWSSQDRELNLLRHNLSLIEHVAESNDGLRLEAFDEMFNFDLAASVIRIVSHNQPKTIRESAPFRAAALKRALEYLDDTEQTRFGVADICKSVGVSWATLERAFALEFGVSPKSYIQARRLAAVRYALLQAEPGALIADIANRWGFWHMGRFASSYRAQFGELPSQTLQPATG